MTTRSTSTALPSSPNKSIASARRAGKWSSSPAGRSARGWACWGCKTRPTDLPHLQAAAAAGQAYLIRLYDDCLRKHGYHAAQVLLTANDFKSRTRYLNVRNTLHTLFEYKAIPVVNENDTVSVAEIKFGDNDQLAAMVTGLLPDPLLIILSIVDGLYDGDPEIAHQQVDSARRPVERFAAGVGGPRPQPAGDRRDAIEARGRAHGDQRGRERDHRQRHASRSARRNSGRARKSARSFSRRARICRPGSGGSASRSGRKGVSFSTRGPATPSKPKANRSWRSASLPSRASLPRARSSRWSTAAAKNSPAAFPTTTRNDARSIAGKRSEEIIQALGSLALRGSHPPRQPRRDDVSSTRHSPSSGCGRQTLPGRPRRPAEWLASGKVPMRFSACCPAVSF